MFKDKAKMLSNALGEGKPLQHVDFLEREYAGFEKDDTADTMKAKMTTAFKRRKEDCQAGNTRVLSRNAVVCVCVSRCASYEQKFHQLHTAQ
jgi:hypothetical protein